MNPREPKPLSQLATTPGTPEARLRSLVLKQSPPEPLSPQQLVRVRKRIDEKLEGPRWSIVAWAIVGAMLISVAGIGWAQDGSLGARIRQQVKERLTVAFQPRRHRVATAEPAAEAAPVPLPALPPLPPEVTTAPVAPPPAAAAAPREVRASRAAPAPAPIVLAPQAPVAVPAVSVPAGPSALGLEAQSLRDIADLLRTGNATVALDRLRAHRRRFPAGVLAEEVDMAELEADVALAHRGDALALIARLERPGGPRAAELRVLHGELLAQGGDCAGALVAWGTGLPNDPALAERLLYGRASCLATVGQTGESREAMREYLKRFPQGRFAGSVHTALGE